MKRYNPAEIEPKWQKVWDKQQTYKAADNSDKPKYYALSFFPYPSGAGLHIGHVRNFTITDTAARFMRMQGHEVMQPMGWDSFGLPAENYAIKTGISPQAATKQNTDNFRAQAKHLGFSIDWSREFGSSDPTYYKWTQWFFLLLHKKGLAYQKESPQFWCETDKTVLANEQVEAGRCWRCGNEVTKKSLNQWFFKITDYADRLEADLEGLDWPNGIKTMQRNWIGRSKGAEIVFKLDGSKENLTVFTTRPDTLFGATFLVVAPEHPIVRQITTAEHKARVGTYVKAAQAKTEIERQETEREKTGAFTGAYAVNPANNEKVPVWVADYVLYGYGTGAIMAVPAHDERDFDFAKKFGLPIRHVLDPSMTRPDVAHATEFHEKEKIVAIVENANGDILCIHWKPELAGQLFVGGTVEKGESPAETAIREIREETGYTDLEVVAEGEETYHYRYFAHSKKLPTSAKTAFVYLRLKSDARVKPQLEETEKANFVVEWISPQEARRITEPLHKYAFDKFIDNKIHSGEGIIVNSGKYSGMPSFEVREKLVADLTKKAMGKERVNYKIRDWLISRQRYWGAPIPIIHCPNDGAVPVPDDQLPVVLPDLKDYAPSGDGRSPLAKVRDWVQVSCPKCGGPAERETDTMDGFACSSWYALRFADPHNAKEPFSKKLVEHWAPVDLYVGGAEHAVMHLLYARMWTKAMYDEGLVSFDEPFKALRNQGMLLAPDGTKFSKSKGNGVDPEQIIASGYGADALRTVILFLAPFDQKTPWSPETLGGVYRFLNRVWALAQEVAEAKGTGTSADIERAVYKAVKKITIDMREFGYNTAIAALMELTNELYKLRETTPIAQHGDAWHQAVKTIAQLLAPFAPHIAEELWAQFGGEGSVHLSAWPTWDDALLAEKSVTIVVQVNGKVRAKLTMPANAIQQDVEAKAFADAHVAQFTGSKKPANVIYVPGRLINIVV